MADQQESPWMQFAGWFGWSLILTGSAIGLALLYWGMA